MQLVSNLDDQASLTTLYTEKAIEFIDENKDQPFFLYLPHSMPHVPLGVSSKFKGKSKQGMYGDVIMEIDWSLGQIIETLKNNGIYDNTIIIYTSDNGPWLNYGNHAGSALPLREGKGTMWEGGPRVPCIISWPDIIKGGMVIHDLTSAIDILPTIADITCADLPDHKIDGISFKGLLTGTDTIGKRNVFYYYYLNQLIGVRKDNWKLVFPHRYRSYKGVEPGNNGFPGPYAEGKSGLELYNLKYDISEEYDSSLIYPEIVEDLEIIADSARADLGDNLRKVKGKGHRQPGRLGPAGKKNVSHIAIGSKIKLSAEPYYMYEGSGISTLIDGALGSYDHNDGQWLGFWGEDVVIDIELNSVCFVDTLSIGFLQDQGPWIFLPSEVIFSHAVDTGNFIETTRFTTQIEKDSLTIVKRYSMILSDSVRFLRIVARNGGNCPDWHPGKGSDSWLFIDEVIAK